MTMPRTLLNDATLTKSSHLLKSLFKLLLMLLRIDDWDEVPVPASIYLRTYLRYVRVQYIQYYMRLLATLDSLNSLNQWQLSDINRASSRPAFLAEMWLRQASSSSSSDELYSDGWWCFCEKNTLLQNHRIPRRHCLQTWRSWISYKHWSSDWWRHWCEQQEDWRIPKRQLRTVRHQRQDVRLWVS